MREAEPREIQLLEWVQQDNVEKLCIETRKIKRNLSSLCRSNIV